MQPDKFIMPRFKEFFTEFSSADLSKLGTIYGSGVVFRDPVHEMNGLADLEDYFASMSSDLDDCRFEYLDELVTEKGAYIKWLMHFSHPRLGSRPIEVRGVSHLQFDSDLIIFHEDFYDLGAMLYEQLPLIGNVTRWLKLRLAS